MLKTDPLVGAESAYGLGAAMPLETGSAVGAENAYDLDAEITMAASNAPMITSRFICTPGCTSPGGGSFCSYCC